MLQKKCFCGEASPSGPPRPWWLMLAGGGYLLRVGLVGVQVGCLLCYWVLGCRGLPLVACWMCWRYWVCWTNWYWSPWRRWCPVAVALVVAGQAAICLLGVLLGKLHLRPDSIEAEFPGLSLGCTLLGRQGCSMPKANALLCLGAAARLLRRVGLAVFARRL